MLYLTDSWRVFAQFKRIFSSTGPNYVWLRILVRLLFRRILAWLGRFQWTFTVAKPRIVFFKQDPQTVYFLLNHLDRIYQTSLFIFSNSFQVRQISRFPLGNPFQVLPWRVLWSLCTAMCETLRDMQRSRWEETLICRKLLLLFDHSVFSMSSSSGSGSGSLGSIDILLV